MTTIETTDILCEFLEVVIHTILHARRLYPEGIFTPRKKYGIVVFQSEHPLLNEYITHVLKGVNEHAKNKQLKQILLCINSNKSLIEKYTFDIIELQNLCNNRDNLLVKLEQDLRNFCLKLTNITSDLKPLPNNSEFSLVLHTTEYSAVAFNCNQGHSDFPWVSINHDDRDSSGILPLHTINTDAIILQIYLEEF